MTLHKKLALRYWAITALCVALLAGLAYHELVTEPRQRQALGISDLPETLWSEYFELFVYAMIPLILGGGWWLMRRTLAPVGALAQSVERITTANLREHLARTGSGDEVDRLTGAFNSMI